MFLQFRKTAYVVALGATLSVLIPYSAIAQDQDHHDQDRHDQQAQDQNRDWSNNTYYQTGMREGAKDHEKNHRKTHKHKFSNDDDRRAYQAGYDNAWQSNGNTRHDEDRPH